MLHDLTIRTISEYLCYRNETLTNLQRLSQRLSQRFYSLRDIFIGQLEVTLFKDTYFPNHKPYGWNKVRALKIEISDIDDLSPIASRTMDFIHLFECPKIIDVSPLLNIREIYLADCPNITDVRPLGLGKVRYLKLYFCDNIEDVSTLGSIEELIFVGCSAIKDVTSLGTVKKLIIMSCSGVTDVSRLATVQNLTLNDCDGIESVIDLHTVRKMTISYCDNIQDLDLLKEKRKQYFKKNPKLTTNIFIEHF